MVDIQHLPAAPPKPAHRLLAGMVVALAGLGLAACSDASRETTAAVQAAPQTVSAVRTLIEQRASAGGQAAAYRLQHEELVALYEPGGHQPLWTDAKGRPLPVAEQALEVLERAADEGLNNADYDTGRLAALARESRSGPALAPEAAAAFDIDLSLSMLRYLRHVHLGRVDPKQMGFRSELRSRQQDFAALLGAAIGAKRVADAAREMAPQFKPYQDLREALQAYRSALGQQAQPQPLPATFTLRPGQAHAAVPLLRARLELLGDASGGQPGEGAAPFAQAVPASAGAPAPESSPAQVGAAGSNAAAAPAPRYEGELVEAVQRFQRRHGMPADGVIGKATVEALNTPLQQRVRQIELAMERLRWMPRIGDRPFVAVNIPMFKLWTGGPDTAEGQADLAMDIIVGKALDTETPVMVDEMRYLVLRPYWNVPRSILRGEILPALERDPAYLDRQDMEMVERFDDRAPGLPPTPENFERLREGKLLVRQRPGPRNSLGLVKFMFPNDENIYLHGTPAKQLFDRSRRDFSHGCVRVADPLSLADWVLRDQPEWTRERLSAAMQGDRPTQVNLKEPVQVLLLYITAMVMPGEEGVHFARDIYGHDRKLEQALAAARPRAPQ